MAKLFRTFALVLAALFALSLIVGCGGDSADEEEVAAAEFSSANPASGSTIAANATISLTFSSDPGDVTVSPAGTVGGGGKSRTITGPFAEGALTLNVAWTNGDGSTSLSYTVAAADNTAPEVTGGTVSDGDEDVDPEPINTDGIEITFSEEVSGNIALQTEAGDNVGWIGTVEGTKGTLEPVAGKEIGNETTYVVKGKVSDAAGNETEVSVTFTTKGKE